jgi:hypothetical protein
MKSKRVISRLIPGLLFVGVFALYASTAAPATLFGDPSEYQFIPAIGGIAHPPGYAFYTLLAKAWQTIVPTGTIAFRTNLLASAVGAWIATAVYLVVYDLEPTTVERRSGRYLVPLFAALALVAAADMWQHAIHANAHIVSAAFGVTHLWLLIRWLRTARDQWLAAFALTLGLAVTQHPITLLGVPAYAVFVLTVRPGMLREWRKLLMIAGCLLIGLTPFLYYPLRSPTAPFGPTDMRTWEGFRRHVTAEGLRVNLFHFGVADQADRALVFCSLLGLQFAAPVILLFVVGLARLLRISPKLALLFGVFLLAHLGFTMNSVQDVMAYLLIPLAAMAMLCGAGAYALASYLDGIFGRIRAPAALQHGLQQVTLVALLFSWPAVGAITNLRRGISLRDFTAAEEYVDTVQDEFGSKEQGAVLLSDWEHLTPLWVHTYTQGETLSDVDVELVYVSTRNPWPQSVQAHSGTGPVYLPDYRPSVRSAGFRLIPWRGLYRAIPPATAGLTPTRPLDVWADGRIHVFGYDLDTTAVRAGDHLALVLYQKAKQSLEGIWMPYARLGPIEMRWTTDSRLLTPEWLAGELVLERYEIPVPFTLPPGQYPLSVGYADLSGGRLEVPLSIGGTTVELATIDVLPSERDAQQGALPLSLANLGNQIALTNSWVWSGTQIREDTWEEPLRVRAGRPVRLVLSWRALSSPHTSYTVFIHLLNEAGGYVLGHDYTPMGGAAPTYLWFPKWLPGQTYIDPYRLALPGDLQPGTYWLEVGMYGMTSLRRLPVVDLAGNLAGDRVILGPIRIE